MTDFNARKVYDGGVKVVEMAEQEASQKKDIVKSLYTAAKKELGYSDKAVRNNKEKAAEVVQLMFSEKYAGNKEYNPLLSGSTYQDFAGVDDAHKQHMHQQALGLNEFALLNIIRSRGLTEDGLNEAVNESAQQYQSQLLQNYLTTHVGTSVEDQKRNYAALVQLDPNIGKINTNVLDVSDLRNMTSTSISGLYNRQNLEDKVGVELPKYQWQNAA